MGNGQKKEVHCPRQTYSRRRQITINKRDIDEYFGLDTLKYIVRQPLNATETISKYDVEVNVCGGGYTGQAGAIRHGISRALVVAGEDKAVLKKNGFLTRDPRMKERKKYGLKRLVKLRNSARDNLPVKASHLRGFFVTLPTGAALRFCGIFICQFLGCQVKSYADACLATVTFRIRRKNSIAFSSQTWAGRFFCTAKGNYAPSASGRRKERSAWK